MSKEAIAPKSQSLSNAERVIALLHADAATMREILSPSDSADILGYDLGEILKNATAEKTALILAHATTHGKHIDTCYLVDALTHADTAKSTLLLRHPLGEKIHSSALATLVAHADADKTTLILEHKNSAAISDHALMTALCDAARRNDVTKDAALRQHALTHHIPLSPEATWTVLRSSNDTAAFLDINHTAADRDKLTLATKLRAINSDPTLHRTCLILATLTAEEQAAHRDVIAAAHPRIDIAIILGKSARIAQLHVGGRSYVQIDQQMAVIPAINNIIRTAKIFAPCHAITDAPLAPLPDVMMGSICQILAGSSAKVAQAAWAERLRVSAPINASPAARSI